MDKIIFTDCFNTILLRKESDKIVTFNFCQKLGEKYSIEPAVIYKILSKVKIKLALKDFFKTRELEIVFEKAILTIAQILQKNIKSLSVSDFARDAISIYIEAEKESHYLNEEFVEKLREYKKSGYKIYILSEFYCGKEVILGWLNNLGIGELFDDIFVSCDYMASKRSSRLYKKVIHELKVNKKNIIMFGDNVFADVIGARLAGLRAVRVRTKIEKPPKNFKKIIRVGKNYHKLDEIINRYGDNYGFSNHAFPLLLFIKRLYANLERHGVKNVFFLSREGLFLKKLFDIYSAGLKSEEIIKSHYLQVSRNALYRATLKPLKEQDFSYLFNKKHRMSINQFLKTLTFSEQEITDIKKDLNKSFTKKRFGFGKSKLFRKLKNTESFQRFYEIKRKEQSGVFSKYLESFGVDFFEENLHVIDVGWRGSMQDLLTTYLGEKIKVYGWYLDYLKAPFDKGYKDRNIKAKKGLLHHFKNNSQFGNKIFKPIFLDYEQICRANHNCVYGYKLDKNNKVTVIYENAIDEKMLHEKYILPLQSQIEKKFTDLCTFQFRNLSIIEPLALIAHMNMYRKLSKNDVEFYINAINSHFDNFVAIGFPKGSSAIKRFGYKAAALILRLRFIKYSDLKVFNLFYKKVFKEHKNNSI